MIAGFVSCAFTLVKLSWVHWAGSMTISSSYLPFVPAPILQPLSELPCIHCALWKMYCLTYPQHPQGRKEGVCGGDRMLCGKRLQQKSQRISDQFIIFFVMGAIIKNLWWHPILNCKPSQGVNVTTLFKFAFLYDSVHYKTNKTIKKVVSECAGPTTLWVLQLMLNESSTWMYS